MENLFDQESIDISGKSVIITGGTTGIGRATALCLASCRAHVLICGRDQAKLDDALGAIHNNGREAIGIITDMSDPQQIQNLFRKADQELGGVDILINNAALGGGTIYETSPQDQEYIIRTNLLGYMLASREAITRMSKKKDGQIIFVGSMSADIHESGSSLYAATKAGILGLTQTLRKEVNKFGIRISIVEPGETGSDMIPIPVEKQSERQMSLLQLKAEDIAEVIYFILTRPKRADIIEIKIRPRLQEI